MSTQPGLAHDIKIKPELSKSADLRQGESSPDNSRNLVRTSLYKDTCVVKFAHRSDQQFLRSLLTDRQTDAE